MEDSSKSILSSATTSLYVYLVLKLDISLGNFSMSEQLQLRQSLAVAAGLTPADAQMVTLVVREADAGTVSRRTVRGGIKVDAYIACPDTVAAMKMTQNLSPARIDQQLELAGLPPATILVAPEVQIQVLLWGN